MATVQEPMRTILLIEYEYVRIYIHSLPLQAFVERVVAFTPSKQHLDTFGAQASARNDSVANEAGQAIPPAEVRRWMQTDGPYIETLVSACQHVLELVAESKIPKHKLKHFTVRVYFRIMAAAVHLLKVRCIIFCFISFVSRSSPHMYLSKQDYDDTTHNTVLPSLRETNLDPQTFVAGAYEHNIKRSFELLHKSAKTLHDCIVDDVHIGRNFATMITKVASTLEKRLTRFVPASGAGQSRAQSVTPIVARSPAPGATPLPQFIAQPQAANFNWSGAMANGGSNAPPFDFQNWSSNTPSFLSAANVYDESQTMMPPPHTFSPEFANGDAGLGINEGTWFGLDMQPMIGSSVHNNNADVGHSHYGPTLGGSDMLDPYLDRSNLNLPFDQTEQGWNI
jgi:hypothetical protein